MDIKTVKIDTPDNINIILGQSHFIKTVEDLYETIVDSVPNIKFGLAFCEASGACLIRAEGTDNRLKESAIKYALALGAGHSFIILIKDAYPINILTAIKQVPEVCHIYCATANPLEIIIAETAQGKGIMGVIDGFSPKGAEKEEDIKWRKDLLRKIGYKL